MPSWGAIRRLESSSVAAFQLVTEVVQVSGVTDSVRLRVNVCD